MSSRRFQGYLFISVLVNTNSDLIKLIIQSIKNDLASRNPIHVNLALQCIANIGSKEMAEAFGNEIPKLLVSGYDIVYCFANNGVTPVTHVSCADSSRTMDSNLIYVICQSEILWTL